MAEENGNESTETETAKGVDANTGSDTSASSAADNGGADAGSDWRSSLPDELKEFAPEHKDLPSLVKGYKSLQGKLGADPLTVPGEKATDEEKAEFQEKLAKLAGRPEKADDYKLSVPEGMESIIGDDIVKGLKGEAHKLGMSQAQAEGLFGWFSGMIKESNEQAISEAEGSLKQKWGGEYEANVNKAKEYMQTFVSDADKSFVEEHGNDPRLIRIFAQAAELTLGEGKFNVAAATSAPSGTIEDLRQQGRDIMMKAGYNDPKHADYKSLQEQKKAVYQQIDVLTKQKK